MEVVRLCPRACELEGIRYLARCGFIRSGNQAYRASGGTNARSPPTVEASLSLLRNDAQGLMALRRACGGEHVTSAWRKFPPAGSYFGSTGN